MHLKNAYKKITCIELTIRIILHFVPVKCQTVADQSKQVSWLEEILEKI